MKICIISILFLFDVSCQMNENGDNFEFLQGIWQEIEPSGILQLAGSHHTFEFQSDSFFVTIEHFTDAADINDPCSQFDWIEYAAGFYSVSPNLISLNGVYTDSLFKKITSGCWNIGADEVDYPFTFNHDTLFFNPELSPYNDNRIKLVKK